MSPFIIFSKCHRSYTIWVGPPFEATMRIRTITDLGASIRERRHQLGLDQAALAKAAGTSRKWLMEVERGKARAEVGLILKTLKALDLAIELGPMPEAGSVRVAPKAKAIGDLLNSLRGKA